MTGPLVAALVALVAAPLRAPGGGTISASPAPADTLLEVHRIASFRKATSVSVDPSGELVVSDAGRDAVYRLAPDGRVLEALGGTGADAALFDGPHGVDATNGLILLVADAGNGRVQRFARDGRFLEWIPIWSDPGRRVDGPEYRQRDVQLTRMADGRPTDVVSTNDGRLFVVESTSGTVRTWDRERRSGSAVGEAVGDRTPIRPIALATDGERVYVADEGLPGIVVLDRFGRPDRSIGGGIARGIRGVAFGGGCVWMALPGRIVGFSPDGILASDWTIELDGPVVDLGVRDDGLVLLTARSLYIASAACAPEP
jgi:hypothetical protein